MDDVIILLCVRRYLRYSLGFRDLQEIMADRNLSVDHVTIWRWIQRYAPVLNQRMRREMRAAESVAAGRRDVRESCRELDVPISGGRFYGRDGTGWATSISLDRAIGRSSFATLRFASDPSRMPRFEREAKVLASLNHPHIAQIYGVEEGALVMEGEPLKGPLPVERAVEYAGQILDALDAAHKKGIVHRDLTPANILVTRQGIKMPY